MVLEVYNVGTYKCSFVIATRKGACYTLCHFSYTHVVHTDTLKPICGCYTYAYRSKIVVTEVLKY